MRKASDILLLIGGILGFVGLAGAVITAIVMFVLGSPACYNIILEGVKAGTINSSVQGTPEEITTAVQALFVVSGVFCLIFAIPSAVGAALSLKARREGRKGLYVATLVLSIISWNPVSIVGCIFGFIAYNQQQ